MGSPIRYLIAVAALATVACSGSTEPQIDTNESLLPTTTELTLRYGETLDVDGSVLRVTFGRVVEDSRCPAEVYCFWAGNAVVEIGVSVGMGPTVPLQINASMDPRYADWDGIRITALELDPLPRVNPPLKPEDYSVKLRLETIR